MVLSKSSRVVWRLDGGGPPGGLAKGSAMVDESLDDGLLQNEVKVVFRDARIRFYENGPRETGMMNSLDEW